MKKKIYVTPVMMEVKVNTESHLLDASQVGFGSEYSGGAHSFREAVPSGATKTNSSFGFSLCSGRNACFMQVAFGRKSNSSS